jgi:hypothetical protein
MTEMKELRRLLEKLYGEITTSNQWSIVEAIRREIGNIECRRNEPIIDILKTIEQIREMKPGMPIDNGEYIETEYEHSPETCGALIGQYAHKYSQYIRKDRDEWKDLAMGFLDAVQAKLKGETNADY